MAFWRRKPKDQDIDKKQEEKKLGELKEWIDKYLEKHDDRKRHRIIVVPIRLNWILVNRFDQIKDYYLNKGWRRVRLEGQGTTIIESPTLSGLGPVDEISWLYLYR